MDTLLWIERVNDWDVIQRCRAGEGEAFRHLVERYQNEALGHALAILGNREDAADAVQMAFVKAHATLGVFEDGRRFYPWFYVILRNCCLKMVARRQRMKLAEQEVVQILESQGADPALESQVRSLEIALQRLESEDRELITLKHLDRLSYEELSERLNIPRGTVMSRLFYARKRLRAILETFSEGEEQ